MGSSGKRVRLLWALFGVLLAVLVLKTFIADAYPVHSGSMRPTIFGGTSPGADEPFTEHVLVRFQRRVALRRYDLVVIRPRGGGDPIVKRIVALPREKVQIVGGDVLIGGRRLTPDRFHPALIPLFDDRYHDVAELFFDEAKAEEPWEQQDDEWLLKGMDVPVGYDGGMLLYDTGLSDGYLDADGSRVPGTRQVNDAAIECSARLENDGGRLRLQISEEGDTFRAVLHPAEEEGAEGYVLSLIRFNATLQAATDPDKKNEVLLSVPVPFQVGTWHRLHFANIDNHLIFELDRGVFRTTASYEKNEPRAHPGVTKHLHADRIGLGGEACRARFRSIRVLRDLYYTNAGKFAVQAGTQPRVTLSQSEYFVLGDNSATSQDSRSFGPVSAADIVGQPVAVVWPLSRWRWL